jgi:hypothetical protein
LERLRRRLLAMALMGTPFFGTLLLLAVIRMESPSPVVASLIGVAVVVGAGWAARALLTCPACGARLDLSGIVEELLFATPLRHACGGSPSARDPDAGRGVSTRGAPEGRTAPEPARGNGTRSDCGWRLRRAVGRIQMVAPVILIGAVIVLWGPWTLGRIALVIGAPVMAVVVGLQLWAARCPTCGRWLSMAALQRESFLGEPAVHECVGGEVGRWSGEDRARARAGLVRGRVAIGIYAGGLALAYLPLVLEPLGWDLPGVAGIVVSVGGVAISWIGLAGYAKGRGLGPMWGVFSILGVLGIPIVYMLGEPCPRCRGRRIWRNTRCNACEG